MIASKSPRRARRFESAGRLPLRSNTSQLRRTRSWSVVFAMAAFHGSRTIPGCSRRFPGVPPIPAPRPPFSDRPGRVAAAEGLKLVPMGKLDWPAATEAERLSQLLPPSPALDRRALRVRLICQQRARRVGQQPVALFVARRCSRCVSKGVLAQGLASMCSLFCAGSGAEP